MVLFLSFYYLSCLVGALHLQDDSDIGLVTNFCMWIVGTLILLCLVLVLVGSSFLYFIIVADE